MTPAPSATSSPSAAAPAVSTPDPGGDLDDLGAAALGILAAMHGADPAPHQTAHLLAAHRLDAAGRWHTPEVGLVLSRQNGKTDEVIARLLAEAHYGDGPEGARALYVAHSGEVAREVWKACARVTDRVPELRRATRRVRATNGQESIETDRGVIRFLSASGKPPRGFRGVGLLALDELMHHAYTDDLLAALTPTQAAHPRPQLWYTSSAGDSRSTVLNAVRARALAGAPGLSWTHYAAPDACALDDPDAIAAANPALGRWLDLDHLLAAAERMPEPLYRTEHLGQWVALVERWLPADLGPATADPASTVPDGAPVTFGLAADADLTAGAIAAAHRRADGRLHVETVHLAAPSHGPVAAQLRARAVALAASWRGATFAIAARGPLAGLADTLTRDRVRVELVSSPDTLTASATFARLLTDGELAHPADPPLLAALDAARPKLAGGVRTYRPDGAAVVPLTAAILAAHLAGRPAPRALIRTLPPL